MNDDSVNRAVPSAQSSLLTYVVTESHVGGDVHTGGLLVPGQLAPVSEVAPTSLGKTHNQEEADQHHL